MELRNFRQTADNHEEGTLQGSQTKLELPTRTRRLYTEAVGVVELFVGARNQNRTLTNMSENEAVPEVVEVDGVKLVRLVTSLPGYDISDIIVRPVEDKLVVMDKTEKVLKSYPLPESVDPFTVEAELSEEGILTVEAPLKC